MRWNIRNTLYVGCPIEAVRDAKGNLLPTTLRALNDETGDYWYLQEDDGEFFLNYGKAIGPLSIEWRKGKPPTSCCGKCSKEINYLLIPNSKGPECCVECLGEEDKERFLKDHPILSLFELATLT